MKSSLKGALLSGLVFPGLGQIALKHYKRGIALILMVSGGLLVIVVQAMQRALAVFEKMESGGGPMGMNTMLKEILQAPPSSAGFLFNISSGFIIVCWIFGIMDAYRIGRKQDA